MTVKELIVQLNDVRYDLMDAEIMVEGEREYIRPEVLWLSDDRKQVWLGVL